VALHEELAYELITISRVEGSLTKNWEPDLFDSVVKMQHLGFVDEKLRRLFYKAMNNNNANSHMASPGPIDEIDSAKVSCVWFTCHVR
jgi:hypothetical protein